MMIRSAVTAEYQNLLNVVRDTADAGLRALLMEIMGLPPAQQREALHDILPTLGAQYSDMTSEVSTVFFDSLMEMQSVKKPVPSDLLDPMDKKRWHALVGWGASDTTFDNGGMLLMQQLITGGMNRILTEVAGDTMIGNAMLQSELMRAQRVPQPGCCNFCAMLASRFAEYKSAESAGRVVGRGVPVGQGKGHGSFGKGRGIKTRGTRKLGEKYHDHCRCSIVIVTEDNYAELQAGADRYYEAYKEAAENVNSGLTLKVTDISSETRLKNKYEWVKADGTLTTPKSRTREIVRAMEALNPVA
ncbi:hypothetical protein [Glutamicibacter creatinolyticus]|uniref:VG15 protein n=1 Tax=Glutamicibacter creatinolyticus TaxID=162496 RepID=UPI0031D5D3E1